MSRRALHRGTAVVLFSITLAAVVVAQREQGIVRDEVVYMRHGSRYASWWLALARGDDEMLTESSITAHFGGPGATDNNREHPPLMKTLFGLSERLFHHRLGWTSELTAYRLPTALAWSLLVLLVYCFAARVWGYAEGLMAAVLLLLVPRPLFHAGLATFDAPIVTTWFIAIYCYFKGLTDKRWCVAAGVAFGLCLATKHNAILLPVALLVHYLWLGVWSQREQLGEGGARALRAALRGITHRQPLLLACLALLGPAVLILLWPWLWFDTLAHLRAWIGFHLHHVHYNFEYLGSNYNHPPFPWHVALVTTLLTVPVATLAAALVGAAAVASRAWAGRAADPGRAPALLLVLSAGVSMGPFFLGTTPIFGAEKHWAPALPSIAIFAGIGVVWAGRHAATLCAARHWLAARGGVVLRALVMLSVAGAGLAETVSAQPYALSSYNALAGGAPGGADLGMNRQFWGYAARGVLAWLRAQEPGLVYSHDASPAWPLYIDAGLLPAGFGDAGHEAAGIGRSRYAIVVHEKHFRRHDFLIWQSYGTVQPAYVLTVQGVPIVSVYARPLE